MPIYKNVENAPFRIGERVKVLHNPNCDETFDKEFALKLGTIVYFEYKCGCGQTFPNDPMIGVQFNNCNIEEFWKEELSLIL